MLKSNSNIEIRQLLLLNEKGVLVASCNSIFKADRFLNKKILRYFPLTESIFPVIRQLQLNEPEVQFRGVETTFKFLKGVYDFTFVKMKTATGDLILWIIDDHTLTYRKNRTEQQLRHEMAIARELLSRN